MKLTLAFYFTLITSISFAQYEYDDSEKYPYEQPNPEAPKQLYDYDELIGLCNCTSTKKNQQGKWGDPVDMTWEFKYIMNGMAVQDQTLKNDSIHSGSIRQFNTDSSKWYVHFYSVSGAPKTLQTWEGNRTDDKIILYKNQKAPNGVDGYYRITFFDITKLGFNWIGEWTDLNETMTFPIWKINCTKTK